MCSRQQTSNNIILSNTCFNSDFVTSQTSKEVFSSRSGMSLEAEVNFIRVVRDWNLILCSTP